jgi:CheY-specific phosphatase CheX
MGRDVVAESRSRGTGSEERFGLMSSLRLSGSIQGAAHVRYTLPMATYITCRMLEAEPPIAQDTIADAMGELANMIVGNVKSSLERQVGFIRIGTPIAGVPTDVSSDLPSVAADFRWKGEPFSVLFAFRSSPADEWRFSDESMVCGRNRTE